MSSYGDLSTPLSDEELTALALAADPNVVLADDAQPWRPDLVASGEALPDWYMPRATASHWGTWSKAVVVVLIVGFLVIDGFGLCITSGFLSLA